jgi:hypothetical protein
MFRLIFTPYVNKVLFWQKKLLSYFSFKVGNILLKSGGVNSKWKSNFDWKRKWNYQNEMNIEEYVGKIESGNV